MVCGVSITLYMGCLRGKLRQITGLVDGGKWILDPGSWILDPTFNFQKIQFLFFQIVLLCCATLLFAIVLLFCSVLCCALFLLFCSVLPLLFCSALCCSCFSIVYYRFTFLLLFLLYSTSIVFSLFYSLFFIYLLFLWKIV